MGSFGGGALAGPSGAEGLAGMPNTDSLGDGVCAGRSSWGKDPETGDAAAIELGGEVTIAGPLDRPCFAAIFFVVWAVEVPLALRARRRLPAAPRR